MDEKKILIVNLSKGKVGEGNANLIGSLLITKIYLAAMSRSDSGPYGLDRLPPFYFYVDEFQNFTTDSISTILSEARKYKLNLTIAHQYISQIDERIRDSVFGNVGTIGAFRVGAEDAEFLEKQFEPQFSRFDLVNLDNFHVILKMMLNHKISTPFKMQTVAPKKGSTVMVKAIKKISKLKYGQSRSVVEEDIIRRSFVQSPIAAPTPVASKSL
jgi:hypothetical protein